MGAKIYKIGSYEFCAPFIAPGLYLVATPIGNLKDISLRGLEILAGVDYIACEDKRVSQILLRHYEIKQKLLSYHEHNAQAMIPKLVALLQNKAAIALISDAGTPLISDPGFALLRELDKHDINYWAIPGATAFVPALLLSGLASDNFNFMGFLPHKAAARLRKLEQAKASAMTSIFYEAPHRLLASLSTAQEVFGPDHQGAIARELTKKFETINKGSLGELYALYSQGLAPAKGEMVLLLAPYKQQISYNKEEILQLLKIHSQGKALAKATQEVAQKTGLKKSDLYRLWLEQQD